MKKYRLFSILCMALAVACLLLLADPTETAAATEVSSGTCGDNLTWTLDDAGTLTISGTGPMWTWNYRDNTSPWYSNTSIKKAVIEEGVTTIGAYAFERCTSLTEVHIPSTMTSIEIGAFNKLTNLTDVYISSAEAWCSVEIANKNTTPMAHAENLYINGEKLSGALVLSDGVKTISPFTFYNVTGLTSIKLPDSVTGIGDSAFEDCTGLTGVDLSENLKQIGVMAFYGCTGLETVVIPDSVTVIENGAFNGCTGLKTIEIPDSVTVIEDSAFANCSSLKTIVIPDSVTFIGAAVLQSCSSLEDVTIPFFGPDGKLIDGCYQQPIGYLFSKPGSGYGGTTQSYYDEQTGELSYMQYLIPSSLKRVTVTAGVIPYGAFENCENLTSVTLKSGVNNICEKAFYFCRNLTEITIPGTVEKIGNEAFGHCESLTKVTIEKGVTGIGYRAFVGSSKLEEISIPGSVCSIGVGAFLSCTSLVSVTIPDTVTAIEDELFFECTSLESVTIGQNTKSIGNNAFYRCYALTAVIVPDSVTHIGDSAFYENTGLQTVTLGKNLVGIGEYAFYNCSALKKVVLPDSLVRIGTLAFSYCTALESVTAGAALRQVGQQVFFETVWLDRQPEGMLYLGKVAYYYKGECPENVVLREGTTGIAGGAFLECDSLVSIDIPETVTVIERCAFALCSNLKTINIPSGVTYIALGAFEHCKSLETITIPAQVKRIESSTFAFCSALSSVEILGDITYIGNHAFSDCYALSEITLPETLNQIDAMAFIDCSGIQTIYFNGTRKQWRTIEKGSSWDENTDYGLVCADDPVGSEGLEYEFFNGYYSVVGIGTCKDTDIVIPYTYQGRPVIEVGVAAFEGNQTIKSVMVGAESLAMFAFSDCAALETVILNEDMTIICGFAFVRCPKLKTIHVPASVELIDDGAFTGCTALTEITVDPENPVCVSVDGVLYSKDKTVIKQMPGGKTGEYSIPEGVKAIDFYAFYKCSGLTSLTIPNSMNSIGMSAFREVSGLETVYYNGTLEQWDAISKEEGWDYEFNYKLVCLGEGSKNLVYRLNTEKTGYEVTGIGTCTDTDIVIPQIYEGLPVVGINASAFKNNTTITSVTLPDTITTIETNAFYGCTGLTGQLDLPDALVEIGSYAFYNCAGLTGRLELPDGLVKIDSYAFYNCTGLAGDLIIPEGVITISDSAFRKCAGFESVTLGDAVETVGNHAFNGCTGMTGVYVSDIDSWCSINFASYQANPLYYAKNLYCDGQLVTELVIPGDVTTIGSYVFYGYTSLKSVSISGGVTEIGARAFYNCTSLEMVTLHNGVETIGDYAFYGCTSLTEIEIPGSIKTINNNAFSGCTGLKAVYISDIAHWCAIDFVSDSANPLYYAKNLYCDGQLVTELVIPGDVTTIGSYVFYGYTSLKSVSISGGVTEIGARAFYNCTSLEKVTLHNGVETIGEYAFYGCTALTEIEIPSSVKTLDTNAFRNCTGLTKFTVGAGVETIGMNAFSGCRKLTQILFYGSVPEFGSGNVFYRVNGTAYYPAYDMTWTEDSRQNYGGTITWVSYDLVTQGTCGEGVQWSYDPETKTLTIYKTAATRSITQGTMTSAPWLQYYKNEIETVVIEDGVLNVVDGAFKGCENLETVTIAGSVTQISANAFANCESMQTVTFEGNAPTLEKNAFTNTTATVVYPVDDRTWNKGVQQDYAGTLTWAGGESKVEVAGTTYTSFDDALAACGQGQYLVLKSHVSVDVTLTKDLYVDLNGFDLTGTVVTNGYKIYGMDSTTDGYTCSAIGYMNLVDENGAAIVPETHFGSDITGTTKRYMAIKTDDGYSFHRFYLGLTHMSLKPTVTGVGYKAVFYGDQMVAAVLDSFGFTMQLEGYDPITVYMSGDKFVSGKTITLRIQNYDAENFGETALSAKVMLQLSDGTVIESTAGTMTLRGLMEQLNKNYTALTQAQLTAVAEMIERCPVMKSWEIGDLIDDDGYVEISPDN